MNWIDLVIIFLLIFFAIEGYGRSLFSETVDLISFLIAFIVSLNFYQAISSSLENIFSIPHSFANVLGFIIIWYLIEITLLVLTQIILKDDKGRWKIPYGNFLSIFPATIRGVVFVAIILVLIVTLPVHGSLKKDVQDSKIGSLILTQTYQIEAPLKSVFGGIANDTLTFLTIKPQSGESVELGFNTDNYKFDDKLAQEMVSLVNIERGSRGLKPLGYNPRLEEVGEYHSADMFQRGYFAHNSPEGADVADRALQYGVKFTVIGENLAFAPSLELAHKGLMNSPGHKANILSTDYRSIGIGVARSDEYGLMFTQVFSD